MVFSDLLNPIIKYSCMILLVLVGLFISFRIGESHEKNLLEQSSYKTAYTDLRQQQKVSGGIVNRVEDQISANKKVNDLAKKTVTKYIKDNASCDVPVDVIKLLNTSRSPS